MPRQEMGPEQTEQEQDPVYLTECYDCGDSIYSNHRSMNMNTRFGYQLCEDCTRSRFDNARYHCAACDEEHVDETGWHWDLPEWMVDEGYPDLEPRSRMYFPLSSRFICSEEMPECEECGDSADLSAWDGDIDTINEHRLCRGCRRGPIHSWNYVPPLRFRAVDNAGPTESHGVPDPTTPYLGVELEMENAASRAREIINLFEGDGRYVWLKSDGSLDSNGVEMVTHPATFEWYMEHFPWESLGELSKMGATAYHTTTAGIHIHVSSSAFTAAHLFKFLAFHYRNPIVCQTIGQRGSARYCSWSNWLATRPNLIEYVKKNDQPHDRYVAVNLTEDETVELRYFKGNLSPTRVKKNLQWVDAIYRYTKQVRGVQMGTELDFNVMFEWLRDQRDRYPDLLQFIDARDIRPDGSERVPVSANEPDV